MVELSDAYEAMGTIPAETGTKQHATSPEMKKWIFKLIGHSSPMNYNSTMMNKMSTGSRKTRIISWSNRFFIAGLIFFIAWLLIYAWNVIVAYGPVGYREGANMLLTEYILKGRNPFVLMNQPLMNTNKGAFYNLLVVPFAAVFGGIRLRFTASFQLFLFFFPVVW